MNRHSLPKFVALSLGLSVAGIAPVGSQFAHVLLREATGLIEGASPAGL